jgi:hypothetical protein
MTRLSSIHSGHPTGWWVAWQRRPMYVRDPAVGTGRRLAQGILGVERWVETAVGRDISSDSSFTFLSLLDPYEPAQIKKYLQIGTFGGLVYR